ncbi:Uncharacterised protein g7110 [Pycnogonum litorale]
MLENDVIVEVTEPTDWVNSIRNMCLDPKDLNKNILREPYYTRTIDELIPKLHGIQYFSVVDTKKGYWLVELDNESSYLCTFNTPFGRFRFKRLPFGVVLSQDIFQRKLDEVYKDIQNVIGIVDDIVICGRTPEEHDKAFLQMLEATKRNNISLNSEKIQFKMPSVEFYGHTFGADGVQPSQSKIEAMKSIKTPTNIKEFQTILGMFTYLNRYSTKIADLTAPLRELVKKNVHFKCEPHNTEALERVKQELVTTPKIISYYDPNSATTAILQVDASLKGLGAWLRQIDSEGNDYIVAMSSRSLTETEKKYSNIEGDCLGVMYGLEKFNYYILGRTLLLRRIILHSNRSQKEHIYCTGQITEILIKMPEV